MPIPLIFSAYMSFHFLNGFPKYNPVLTLLDGIREFPKTSPKDYDRWNGNTGIKVVKKPNTSNKKVKRGK